MFGGGIMNYSLPCQHMFEHLGILLEEASTVLDRNLLLYKNSVVTC
jgi:hypothetical protein